MKFVVGSDHGAVDLKEEVKLVLREFPDINVVDIGVFSHESVDYPDIAKELCAKITSGECERGIILCGTGIGVSIAANKIKGIRCALCSDVFSAKMSRAHNDANVLALGGRVLGVGPAGEIVRAFVEGKFEGGRHERRVKKLMELEG